MSKLMRSVWKNLRPSQPGHPNDRGAIGVIFAILLATGVIFATVGIVVDLGRVYVNQKIAQRAADEVAQALAEHCQKTAAGGDCDGDSVTTASPFGSQTQPIDEFLNGIANPNGTEGVTIVTMCGYSSRSIGLNPCNPLTTDKWDCQTNLTTANDWVRVYVTAPAMSPILANFGQDNHMYQERACGQTYYGKVGSITIDSTTSPLPIMIGMCELSHDSGSVKTLLVAELNESSCDVKDRTEKEYKSNGRGWRIFNTAATPVSNKYCWTISLTNACSPLALSSKTTTSTTYIAFINLIKANLNKSSVLPIFEKNNSGYFIRGFISFKLLGYKFPTITGVTATTTTSTPSGYTWPSSGNCSGTATSSSKFCIVGSYENKSSTPYGKNRGVTITNDVEVPDFGYTIFRHER